MTNQLFSYTMRIAEITAQLAERKRAYFVDGIESPMAERTKLEAEMATLRAEKYKLKGAENTRNMQVRQLRGAILRERLITMGFPTLMEECNALAESQIPAVQV